MEDNNRGGLLGFIVVTAIGAVAASAAWEGGKDLYSWAKGKVTAMVIPGGIPDRSSMTGMSVCGSRSSSAF